MVKAYSLVQVMAQTSQEKDSVEMILEDTKLLQSISCTKEQMEGSLTMMEALVINFVWDMGTTFERVCTRT
jgi:hypothetical protein